MKIPYSLLISALLLSACGSETKVDAATASATATKTTTDAEHAAPSVGSSASQEQRTAATTGTAVATTAENTPVIGESVSRSTAAEHQSQQAEPLLPLGRLVGVVDSGDYRQATIDNQGKVIRLRVGDDWQGWEVKSIGQKKVVISRDNAEYSLLLLSEFRAPAPAQGQLALQQVAQSLAGDPAAPQFTQEQLLKLRSNLLMGRPVTE